MICKTCKKSRVVENKNMHKRPQYKIVCSKKLCGGKFFQETLQAELIRKAIENDKCEYYKKDKRMEV
jgi:hypothetical protein